MRRVLILAAALAAVFFAIGCGSQHTVTVTRQVAPAKAIEQKIANDELIPVARIHAPRESARRPDGYQPGPAAPPAELPGLSGSSIHISPHGLRFIESFEGFSSCPYWDPFGRVATRGYGETEGISMGSRCISRAFGEANLKSRIERFYGWAIRGLGGSFNQNQVDALYSFAWNLGAGIFTGELRRAIQRHNPYPMLAYDHAGGQVLAGLARRRRAEVQLFNTPAHEETPAQHRARVHRERVLKLHRDTAYSKRLDHSLAAANCLHGYRGFNHQHRRFCNIERARHAAVSRDITRLRKLGIR